MKRAGLFFMLVMMLHLQARSEPLGRLFFSSAERARRDDGRRTEEAATGDVLRVDGIVLRSAGPTTVWVNGRPLDRGSADAGVHAEAAHEADGVSLRVGESVDRRTGQRKDLVEAGAIRIGRRHGDPLR